MQSEKRATIERLTAYQGLYKDLQGYEGRYYDVSRQLIIDKAATELAILTKGVTDFEEIEKAKLLVAEVTAQRIKQLDIDKGKSSDEFLAGLRAGIDDIQLRQIKWGQVGYESFRGMAEGMTSAFTTGFEDIYKGKLQGLGDYATIIWDKRGRNFLTSWHKWPRRKFSCISRLLDQRECLGVGIVVKLLGYAGRSSIWPIGSTRSGAESGHHRCRLGIMGICRRRCSPGLCPVSRR